MPVSGNPGGSQVYAVVGISMGEIPLIPLKKRFAVDFLGECALDTGKYQNAKEKEEAAILAKNEQLRANCSGQSPMICARR